MEACYLEKKAGTIVTRLCFEGAAYRTFRSASTTKPLRANLHLFEYSKGCVKLKSRFEWASFSHVSE